MTKYSLIECKRKIEHTPLILLFDAVVEDDKITAQGYAVINPVRPGSKIPIFHNNNVVLGVITVPEWPKLFDLTQIVIERMEMITNER